MNVKNIFYVILIVVIISGCGVSKDDYDKLNMENEKLKTEMVQLTTELDECKFGAEKIAAAVEKAYAEKKYDEAQLNIKLLYEKHPESSKNIEFKILSRQIEKEQLAVNKRKEAEEKERIRLANINNTGIWSVGYYVDEFGEPTKKGYITNPSFIQGYFSNTATHNSRLNVTFLISDSTNISIQLYEYAGNNPVKAYSTDSYKVLIQDKDGNRLKLIAENYSDRLSFDRITSMKVHNILKKGGTIKFKIVDINTPTTEYEFLIPISDWYENAYSKLKGS
jgi:uncharacterized protein YpmB